jgi:hypothetical protein
MSRRPSTSASSFIAPKRDERPAAGTTAVTSSNVIAPRAYRSVRPVLYSRMRLTGVAR